MDKRIAIQSDKLKSGKILWRYGLTPATLCITLQEAFKFIAEIRQSIIDKVKRHLLAVLLFVFTRALLALRERKPFFTFTSSSAFGVLPVSFRQRLDELEDCARFGGADVEG